MKHLEIFYLFFSLFLLFNNSCAESNDQFNDKLNDGYTKKTKISYQADSTNQIVMIYDYDAEYSKLQYRPINIQNPSGNYLKDALNAFIEHNHFLEPTDSISLERIEKEESQIILHFSGLASSNEQKDKRDFFKKALELTVARNFQGKHFKIVLNEEYP
jgi:hypothetical protein